MFPFCWKQVAHSSGTFKTQGHCEHSLLPHIHIKCLLCSRHFPSAEDTVISKTAVAPASGAHGLVQQGHISVASPQAQRAAWFHQPALKGGELQEWNNALRSTSILLLNPYPRIFFSHWFSDRGEGREEGGEREKHRYQRDMIGCLLHKPYPRLGIEPATEVCAFDWESNTRPFGLQAYVPTTEPNQQGLHFIL